MSAAMEDNLTETQRKHLHNQREKMSRDTGHAHHDATSKSKPEGSQDSKAESTNNAKQPTSKAATQKEPVVVEEVTVIGIRLSPEQEKAADRIHEPYLARLMSFDQRIDELHDQLVVLETQRLLKIEEILTKEQREELRKEHQQMKDSPKISSTDANSKAK